MCWSITSTTFVNLDGENPGAEAVTELDVRSADEGAGCIGYLSSDLAGGGLRMCLNRGKGYKQKGSQSE
jgi:hypothetical protein